MSLDQLIKKILTGTATNEERSLFWRWIWKFDTRVDRSEDARLLAKQRAWTKIQLATQKPVPARNWRPLVAAASIITVILAGWAIATHKGRKSTTPAYTLISNESDKIRKLTLPDGTQAILDIHSSIQYPSSYNEKERRIYLNGEGYFTVAKDDSRPFIVQTGEIQTQALGTSINIESHDKEGQIRVALTEGRIAVSLTQDQTNRQLLTPGQILFYDKTTGNFSTTHYTTDVTAWTRGGLVFNNMPLKEALHRLAERYQLQLNYNTKQLAGRTITSSFGNIGWKDILTDICLLHDLSWHEKNKKIIIE
jgi:ferric-dicitrate binding protein FerR (iron transport regulator)